MAASPMGHIPLIRPGLRRIYILPTATGMAFALLLLALLAASINYSLGLGYALVYLLLSIGLLGMFHTVANLKHIELSPATPPPVFAGELAQCPWHVSAPAPDRFGIRLAWVPPVLSGFRSLLQRLQRHGNRTLEAQNAIEFALTSGETHRVLLPYPTRERGRHRLPGIRLSSVFPLGFYCAWHLAPPPSSRHPAQEKASHWPDILVYPKPVEHPQLPLPPLTPQPGNGPAMMRGGDDDFSGFRTYQPADGLRHVAWKQVARRPEHAPWLVKEFEGGAQPERSLDLMSALRVHGDLETALSILTGWVLAAEALGERYSLRLPRQTVAASQGPQHLQRCLETLALYE